MEISRKVSILYTKMIFEDGYVHCDPHPGNVLINKELLLLFYRLNYDNFEDNDSRKSHSENFNLVGISINLVARIKVTCYGVEDPYGEVEIILLDHGLYAQLSSAFR